MAGHFWNKVSPSAIEDFIRSSGLHGRVRDGLTLVKRCWSNAVFFARRPWAVTDLRSARRRVSDDEKRRSAAPQLALGWTSVLAAF